MKDNHVRNLCYNRYKVTRHSAAQSVTPILGAAATGSENIMVQLVRQRLSWRLTIYGWMFVVGALLLVCILFTLSVHSFLSYQNPVSARTIVISGTLPDSAIEAIIGDVGSDPNLLIVTVGGPITRGSRLSLYRDYANFTAARIEKIGRYNANVVAVPSSPTERDRVYESALALRAWMHRTDVKINSINVYTMGVRSRRTQILFDMAFEDEIEVGVISIHDPSYDHRKWWSTSQGVRTVSGELIAYSYAKFLFWPE